MGRSVEELLAAARSRVNRIAPETARGAQASGDAVLVDIRPETQRDRDGLIPGAVHVPRNVLEWRLDPASAHRDPSLTDAGARVVVVCDEGYQSSLAAALVQDLGIADATDLEGGFQAWREAGLPVDPGGS